MKIGDLVKLIPMTRRGPQRVGVILELVEKKCWRTDVFGNRIDWEKIDPETHAVILINGDQRTIPITDLVTVNDKE